APSGDSERLDRSAGTDPELAALSTAVVEADLDARAGAALEAATARCGGVPGRPARHRRRLAVLVGVIPVRRASSRSPSTVFRPSAPEAGVLLVSVADRTPACQANDGDSPVFVQVELVPDALRPSHRVRSAHLQRVR